MLRGQTSPTMYSPTWKKISAKEEKEQVENGRRYVYGNYVHGDLSLDICWVSRETPTQMSPHPCYHEEVWFDGCYNFSVNASLLGNEESFPVLEIQAKVTDSAKKVTRIKVHRGPEKSKWPLNIRLEDYTDGYFKPMLPYHGK
ncbi:alpha-2-macroglobulin, partial [Plakobranchus ocellatus]